MANLKVSEKPNMTYSIAVDGTVVNNSVEKVRLKGLLASYNVVGDRFNEALGELAIKGCANVEIPLGKFEQVR